MEHVFLFADQIEAPDETVDWLWSNFEDMVIAILQWKPDPRLLPDNDE